MPARRALSKQTTHPVKNPIVNIALIGAGGMGENVIKNLLPFPDAKIIAVADPFLNYQDDFYYKRPLGAINVANFIDNAQADKFSGCKCRTFQDFRVMLDQMPEIDAVVCATPDHLHAYVSIYCMRHGKHVYCEKPLAHNIREVRLMAKVAAETGVATQMGNIGHARDGMREACEWLWDGAIGPVHEAHAWVRATRWNKGMILPPEDTPPVPPNADWDLWIGPRQFRPYHPTIAPVRWRDFWNFGLGAIGDFVCHDMDVICWALKLGAPHIIEACQAGKTSSELIPYGEICHFFFKARGRRPAIKATWYDGGLQPPTPAAWPNNIEWPTRGCFFVGEKGLLVCPGLGSTPFLLPEKLQKNYTPPTPTIPRSPGHHREWLNACKGGPAACADFEYSARLTEIALTGVLALRTGKRIVWDAKNMKAIGCPEADDIINGQPYRKGWEI